MRLKTFVMMFFALFMLQATAVGANYYFWQGKLGGNNVKWACAVEDGIMTGEMFLADEGNAVYEVAGYEQDGMFDIRVYSMEGGEKGIYMVYFLRAQVKGGELVGVDQQSAQKFRLRKYQDKYAYAIDGSNAEYSSPYIEGKTYLFHGWDRGGEYLYENASGVKGELTLWANFSDDSYNLSIRRDSGAYGAGNDALVEAPVIYPSVEGDFTYTIPGCGYTFSVKFYDHFLVIRSVTGSPKGCFGSGAAITGIYIMVPAKG